jgi:predicted Ser/Thr protein kinase
MKGDLRPGDPRQLGEYQLVKRLGGGGMGDVYLGRSAEGRPVAVKVVRPELVDDDEFRARFRSEVTQARQVPPFCTAEVIDADPDHETPYLVVEYVDGPSLAEVVAEQGPLEAGSLHSVAVGMATALAAIHGAGVVHRDLKPGNVLFALGNPKVIDFGIARAMEAATRHTRTDHMVGTVAYMAPERFDTENPTVSPAADVFAWGVVVAYAGTGRTPFGADSAAATAAGILTKPPRLTGLSGSLRDLVALTLAKDPKDRPSAHELLDMLLAADTAELGPRPDLRRAAEAVQESGRHTTGRRGRRRRLSRTTAWIAAAAATGVLVAVPALAYSMNRDPRPAQPGTAPSTAASAAQEVRGPTIVDRLDRPGLWPSTKTEAGICAYKKALVVQTRDSNELRCPGPSDTFAGDQTIAVDAQVDLPGSCALIYFRTAGQSSYLLAACPDRVDLRIESDNTTSILATARTTAFAPGKSRRIVLDVSGGKASATVDGDLLLSGPADEPALVAGQVTFGVESDRGGYPAEASFTDAEIRSR